jgi:hypothetical protein
LSEQNETIAVGSNGYEQASGGVWGTYVDKLADLEQLNVKLWESLRVHYEALYHSAGVTPRQRDDARRLLMSVPLPPVREREGS